jgi:hypothetical protein
MPEQDLIDVRVLVDGQPLQEYREPEATDEGPDRVRYVEVKAGQEFGIQITWKAGFDLKWTDALAYRLYVDDHNFFSYGAKEKRSIPHRRGTLVNDVLQVDESISFKNDVTGEWGICAYAFGVLGMSEWHKYDGWRETDRSIADDAPIDPCLKQGDIQELGCIRVKICRANKVKLDEPYCWQGQRPKTLDEIFENSLKGRALKNNVK